MYFLVVHVPLLHNPDLRVLFICTPISKPWMECYV